MGIMKRFALLLALLLGAAPLGCVTRRFVIDSEPRGAMVFRDGQPIGPTPVEQPFVYYGRYRVRVVKDGYEPLDVEPEICAPCYQYPGIDFIAENLIPFTFRDIQELRFQLREAQSRPPELLRARADELRERGQSIMPPAGAPLPP